MIRLWLAIGSLLSKLASLFTTIPVTMTKQVLRRGRIVRKQATRKASRAASKATRSKIRAAATERAAELRTAAEKAQRQYSKKKNRTVEEEAVLERSNWFLRTGADVLNFALWEMLIELINNTTYQYLEIQKDHSKAEEADAAFKYASLMQTNFGGVAEFALAGIAASQISLTKLIGKGGAFSFTNVGKVVTGKLKLGETLGKGYNAASHGLKNFGVRLSNMSGRSFATFSQTAASTVSEGTPLRGKLNAATSLLMSKNSRLGMGLAALVAIGYYTYDFFFDEDETSPGALESNFSAYLREIELDNPKMMLDGRESTLYTTLEQMMFVHGMLKRDPVRGWYELRSERAGRAPFSKLDISMISTALDRLAYLCYVEQSDDAGEYFGLIQSLDSIMDLGFLGAQSGQVFTHDALLLEEGDQQAASWAPGSDENDKDREGDGGFLEGIYDDVMDWGFTNPDDVGKPTTTADSTGSSASPAWYASA